MGCFCCRNYILKEDKIDLEEKNEKDECFERLKFILDEEIQYDEYTCGCFDFDDVYFMIQEEDEDRKYYYNLHYSLENGRDDKISVIFYNLHYANAKRI